MQIQVRTDNHIEGGERLSGFVEETISGTLSRFAEQITRVEVHLQDENSHKPGENDKRCTLEVRLAGLKPVSVSHHDASVDKALAGALHKMEKRLDGALGRLGRRD